MRPARRSDLVELLDMMKSFNRAERIAFRRERTRDALGRLLRERRLGRVVVAARPRSRALAGYGIATFGYDLEFGGVDSFVTELFVRPRHRRGGLGLQLLEALADALRAAGARATTLLVRPENGAARRLYARAGFTEIHRVAMVRRLSPRESVRPVSALRRG